MSPLQIASVIVLIAFVALIGAGTIYRSRQRQPGTIRRAAPPPGGSASVAGDHRAGGEDFRADALAAAEDPIATPPTQRSRA